MAQDLMTTLYKVMNIFFGITLLIIVLTWFNLVMDGEARLLQVLWSDIDNVLPLPFALQTKWYLFTLAMIIIILWLIIIKKSDNHSMLLSWASGLAVTWSITFLLLMPWINAARSYQDTFLTLAPFIQNSECLATSGLGESEQSMLHYVTGKVAIKIYEGHSGEGDGVTLNKNAQRCLFLLVQDNVHHPEKIQADHWIPIWVGQRPADKNNFTLYKFTQ